MRSFFSCLCTLIRANDGAPQSGCFHLGIKATFQIYSPYSLRCHRHTANQSSPDTLLHRFIVCRCNDLWSLWFSNRLSVLNLSGMKTIIENCFMCHGTCYKSQAKCDFILFYWIVNIGNRVFPVISTVMNSLFPPIDVTLVLGGWDDDFVGFRWLKLFLNLKLHTTKACT